METVRFEDFLAKHPAALRDLARRNNLFFGQEQKRTLVLENPYPRSRPYPLKKPLPMTKHAKERAEELERRVARMIELRRQGVKFSRIAEEFGVSRQRVDQIAHAHLPKELFIVHHVRITVTCPCGVEFITSSTHPLKFHTRDCFLKNNPNKKYKNKQEARAVARALEKFRYTNNINGRKDKQTAATKRWSQKVGRTPHRKALANAAKKRWFERHKHEEGFMEKYKAKQKARAKERYRTDPEFRQGVLDAWKAYKKRKLEKQVAKVKEMFPNMDENHIRQSLK